MVVVTRVLHNSLRAMLFKINMYLNCALQGFPHRCMQDFFVMPFRSCSHIVALVFSYPTNNLMWDIWSGTSERNTSESGLPDDFSLAI